MELLVSFLIAFGICAGAVLFVCFCCWLDENTKYGLFYLLCVIVVAAVTAGVHIIRFGF